MDYEERGLQLIQENRRNIIRCFNKPKNYFFNRYKDHVQEASNGLRRIYIDNGSPILLVAHLDTVHDAGNQFATTVGYGQTKRVVSGFHWNKGENKDGKAIIKTPPCDDRLGVATIMVVLPALGINADILLTEGEESGRTTARGFKTDKKYNWMAEFDRAGSAISGGDDGVLYGFDDKAWRDVLLNEAGWLKVGNGTFSDIDADSMHNLGCKGANWAIGYHNYHDWHAYFVVEEWARTVELFSAFHAKHKDTHFAHEKRIYPVRKATTTTTTKKLFTPKSGMVVRTTPAGRPTRSGVIGTLVSRPRRDIWVVVDNDRNVIDVATTTDIIEQVVCQNCFVPIMDEHYPVGRKSICSFCNDLLKAGVVPEAIRQSFFSGSGKLVLDGDDGCFEIESIAKEGALLSIDGVPIYYGYGSMVGAKEPETYDKVVTINGAGEVKYILKEQVGNKAYIHQQGADDSVLWGVPVDLIN